MRDAFDEERISTQTFDPVEDRRFVEFDWEELYTRVGEAEGTDENREKLGQAFRGVIFWLLADLDRNPKHAPKVIAARALALGLEFFPEALERSRQARELAKAYGLREEKISKNRSKLMAKLRPIERPDLN
jgi:hypothetical protein